MKFIFFIVLICIFLNLKYTPSLNPLPYSLRLDDFLILLSVIVFAGFKLVSSTELAVIRLKRPVTLIILFSLWQFSSGILNALLYAELSMLDVVLFSLRHIEYMLIFVIAKYSYAQKEKIPTYAIYYLIFILLFVMAQKIGYWGEHTVYNTIERQTANFSGPWELAVVAAFFLFSIAKIYKIGWAFVLFSTVSRITILAVVVVYLRNLITFNRMMYLVIVCASSFVLFASTNIMSSDFMSRFIGLFDILAIIEPFEFYNSLPPIATREEYFNLDNIYIKSSFADVNYDLSAFSRFSRWALAFKVLMTYGVEHVFFGMGVSYYGSAVDGAYLRIFLESGVIGLMIYGLFLMSCYKMLINFEAARNYLIVLVITAFFIDIFYASKAMFLLWALIGLESKSKLLIVNEGKV